MEILREGVFMNGKTYEFPTLVSYGTFLSRIQILKKRGLSGSEAVDQATTEVIECFKGEKMILSKLYIETGITGQERKTSIFKNAFKTIR